MFNTTTSLDQKNRKNKRRKSEKRRERERERERERKPGDCCGNLLTVQQLP
jgi:hypothetical protein